MKNFIKNIVKKIANKLGLEILIRRKTINTDIISLDKNEWIPYLKRNEDKNFNLYFEGLRKSNIEWSDNFTKQLKFFSLFQLARQSVQNNIQYDFVECGCWAGHSSYVISKILRENNFQNKFHIFDSFEGGLSDFESHDRHLIHDQSNEELKKLGKRWSSSEKFVRNVLGEFDFIEIYNGWIPDRFKEVEDKNFQFIHIDVDLYKPTLDALKFFYPRLISGGFIVCDDYNSVLFPGAKKAWDEYFSDKKYFLNYESPFGGSFLIK